MPTTVGYTVALATRTGTREITGTATIYGAPSESTIQAAIAQKHTAGTSTPVRNVDLHPAK